MLIAAEAKRIIFRVATDRSHFLLEVRTGDDRQIEISFPASFAPQLLVQAQKLAARFSPDQDEAPEEKLTLLPANSDRPETSEAS